MGFARFVWVAAVFAVSCFGGEWVTVRNDNQRSGHTGEFVEGPYERKWFRDFHGEMIATRTQAIVAEGKCFVGTFAGNFYALDVTDGSTEWKFEASGPVGASACYEGGKVYFGSDLGGFYCVDAGSGELVWEFNDCAGVWVAPLCDGEKVYFGDRAGRFWAVDAETGEGEWCYETGGMILTPGSLSADGKKVVFGSEDMHVYCLEAGGELVWKSEKLAGVSLRDNAPVIWQGLAIVRTNPADSFHGVLNRNGDFLKAVQQGIAKEEGDKVLQGSLESEDSKPLHMLRTERRHRAEQEAVREYLEGHRYDRTFYAFELEEGEEPWVAPVFYTCGVHNPATGPTFNPETGKLYTFYRTSLTDYRRGIRRYSALGELDRESGMIGWSWPAREGLEWYNLPMIGDETQVLSMMGDKVVGNHQGCLAAVDPETEELTTFYYARDTYAGIFGPVTLPHFWDDTEEYSEKGYLVYMPNQWHGPDAPAVAVAEGRMFWVAGSQVVCIGGPDVEATASGGTEPPGLIKVEDGPMPSRQGHLGLDESVKRPAISVGELERFIEAPDVSGAGDESEEVGEVKELLNAEVAELVGGGPWAAFVVELGISGEQRNFYRSAEIVRVVSQALPYLEDGVAGEAREYLAGLVERGCPLEMPVMPNAASGKRREIYDFGPGMKDFVCEEIEYEASIEDVYALWAYGHYTGDWGPVRAQAVSVEQVYKEFAGEEFEFDHADQEGDAAEHLNRQIAGVIGYVRLMEQAGQAEKGASARELLGELVNERVYHELANRDLVRDTSRILHRAKVVQYCGLVPETAGILREFAGGQMRENLGRLRRYLPVWYHAFGEKMVGGENYISPPHLSQAMFAALADGVGEDTEVMVDYLDYPWCRADVNFIEKLTAVLRNAGGE